MKVTRKVSSLAVELVDHCEKEAHAIALRLMRGFHEVPKEEWQEHVAFYLNDELRHFFFSCKALEMRNPEGMRDLVGIGAVHAGKASGRKRADKSLKTKFQLWAKAEKERNPSLSLNQIADTYARKHNVCAATLRRYVRRPKTAMD